MTVATKEDVIVIGGGLAGLTAAATLAQSGLRPLLLEASADLGGRARVRQREGFTFNLGPHALYAEVAGRALASLGVRLPGRPPPTGGALALERGVARALPTSAVGLLTDRSLSLKAKLQVGRFFARVTRGDLASLCSRSVDEVLRELTPDEGARAYVAALLRVSTYGNANELVAADAALTQLRSSLRAGVTYLDGGWRTVTDQLRALLEHSGGSVLTGTRVTSLARANEGFRLTLKAGRELVAADVVVALPFAGAGELLRDVAPDVIEESQQVTARAACLTVGLSSLPCPDRPFALGLDQPLYLSVHSLSAQLAPSGGAVVHAAWYTAPQGAPADVEARLEAMLDEVQPGWRERLVERWWLPDIAVAPLPSASGGGLSGRPSACVPGARGLFLAGDYVGAEGILADASVASARSAAALLLARRGKRMAA